MLNDYLDYYYSLGLNPTPVKSQSKRPLLSSWQKTRLNTSDWNSYITSSQNLNLGIVLGVSSSNCVDIDLDTAFAARLGQAVLPPTGFIYGRASHPFSHRFYRIEGDAGSTIQFEHPTTGEMLVEYRGNGSQSVVPGSFHSDTGEAIRFEDQYDGFPGVVDRATLLRGCGLIATGCMFAERWSHGRHKAALAFASFCARSNVGEDECLRVTSVICEEVNDEECEDRRQCVRSTFERWRNGEPITGHDGVVDCLGSPRAVDKAHEWLGGKSERASGAVSAAAPSVMIETSEFATAKAFCDDVGCNLLYCDSVDTFYYRCNDVYDPISIAAAKQIIIRYLEALVPTIATFSELKQISRTQSINRVNSIVEYAKSYLRASIEDFDVDPMSVGVRNGTVDLRSGDLIRPSCIITKRLGTNFDHKRDCPRFIAFLNEVFADDQEKIAFVQRALGYTLTGSVAGQVMFVAIGSGANGKSTFLKIIQTLMGDYAASLPPHSLMVSKFGADKTDDLASLLGKRFVSVSEGELGSKLAVAKVKRMTGGDVISCRHLYGRYFDLRPEYKLWFATNDLPQISGGDEAIWRRIYVIDFPVSFGPDRRDAGLYDKLLEELPGILNWALEGVRSLGDMKGNFLDPPATVLNATRAYRTNNDTVGEFVSAFCERDEDSVVMMGDLYGRYEAWCENSGIDLVTKTLFGKELTRLGYEVHKTKRGNGRKGLKMI